MVCLSGPNLFFVIGTVHLNHLLVSIMNNKLFVGNISWEATNEDLEALFAEFGVVTSARIVTDKFSGKSRGFGFVEMATDEQAQAAIEGLDTKDFMGRDIAVNVARPKE